jgi:hypothetical protein
VARIVGAASLIVAGIAGQIIAASHRPTFDQIGSCVVGICGGRFLGWSRTAYDVVRIGSWALVVFGVVLTVAALLRYRTALRAVD